MGDFIRLQKILAQAGFGSRRSCETFILEGRVAVDGVVVRHLGTKADPETQVVTLDGEKVAGPGKAGKRLQDQSEKVYYALNKPVGVLCTNSDPSGRPLAIQMIPEKRRLFCVGRLDLDTEGLLFLTNDGELAHLLTHPRFGVPKTYMAKVGGMVSGVQMAKLKRGVFLSEGRTQGALVRVRKQGTKASSLEITIQEGLNRQVRRMLAAVGLQCRSLRRVRVGPIALGAMPPGAYRLLSRDEVESLRRASSSTEQKPDVPSTLPEAAGVENGDLDRRAHAWSASGERERSPRPSRKDAYRPHAGKDDRRSFRTGAAQPRRDDVRPRRDSNAAARPRDDGRSGTDRYGPRRRRDHAGTRERGEGGARYDRSGRGQADHRDARSEKRTLGHQGHRPHQRDERDGYRERRSSERGYEKRPGPGHHPYQDRAHKGKGRSGQGGSARPWDRKREARQDGRRRLGGGRGQDQRREGF